MLEIRAPRATELELLRGIERDAGRAFAEIGMVEIADDEPLSIDALEAACAARRAWVAVDGDDVPVAYLVSSVIDGCAHVEQVSVSRSACSRGIGSRLIDHLGREGAAEGREWVTLTTFRDVPWNAPYYRRLGFSTIDPGERGRELADLIAREAAAIPGGAPRVAMRRRAEASRPARES